MAEVKTNKRPEKEVQQEQLHTLVMMTRLALASKLGMSYNNDRDMYEALGYPKQLTYADYAGKYERQDIASAIINKPVTWTWKGQVNIVSSEDEEVDIFNEKTIDLFDTLKLKTNFIRLDKLSQVGRYGVLLLGFNDVKNKEGFKIEVKKQANLKLIYTTPYSEDNAQIHSWETNTNSPRYGKPLYYNLSATDVSQAGGEGMTTNIIVHHSRIIHVSGETLESETYGIPALQRVYNRLLDLEKTVGGSAEMFWRGARPGINAAVDKEYEASTGMKDALEDQMKEYEHNLRRILLTEGVDLKSLEQQIGDPTSSVSVSLDMISAATNIPKRILIGSERGELASSQDMEGWYSYVETRREEFAQEQILYPFFDKLIELGILPDVKYMAEWTSLHDPSEKDKAEVGKIRAGALKEYTANPMAMELMPPEMFMKFFLGMNEQQQMEVSKYMDELMVKETAEGMQYEQEVQEIEQEKEEEETEE